MKRITLVVAVALLSSVHAARAVTEQASLNKCQAKVKTAAERYAAGYSKAVGTCLQAISREIIQKNASDPSGAAKTCVAQFRKLNDSRNAGKSLGEKLAAAIDKKCASGTHTLADILGTGAGVPVPAAVERLEAWCQNFGGSGSITTLQQWIDCVAASHACSAQQTIATEYPRAIEWLGDVRPFMNEVSPPSSDPTAASDAVAGLDAVMAAMDPDNTGQSNFLCGGIVVLPPGSRPLRTGQTQCDQGTGTLGPCPGFPAGQDGSLHMGPTRSCTEPSPSDGTIIDSKTGLMWEKLSWDGTIHDYTTVYTWYTALATKISTLNTMNRGAGFANHTDWRLPNRFELETLVDLGRDDPAIDPVFNTGCAPNCTVLTCSCTQSAYYWSSTTHQFSPDLAWFVYFLDGSAFSGSKSNFGYLRAVRGGS
jgi:hypothetical protein